MEEIYRRHAKMIYGFLFSKCADANLAEELTQETFYQALKSIDSFRGDSNVGTWLCGIAEHTWQNYLRKQAKRKASEASDSDINATETMYQQQPSAEQVCISKLDTLSLLHALHSLDEPMREIMYLRLMGELSFREIGEIIGCSENYARVMFYRGKEKIKRGFL